MKTLAYIPARLKSTRFENKILKHFLGKPLLQWAYENAKKSDLFDAVVILADDPVTVDLAKSFNAPFYLTSKNPQNGTERIIEALENGAPTADKIVNVQADEPLLTKTVFQTLLKGERDAGCRIWTLKRKIETPEELHAPQIVKVVTNWRGEALYFSRSVIPFDRDNTSNTVYYRHVGLYAYTPEALKKISTLPRSSLESAESLEQLTPLYHGIPIEVFETSEVIHGVDVPEDLVKLELMGCQISI
ncbi:MAG: 3-deoxy-manno-octulosonate cytidylyltransferase [Chlamydiae bacterium]|nr:3-deoxy-manno-octulosonate cytidylyltransferase [Chlamydiota bacterium]